MKKNSRVIQGIGVSPGITIGTAYLLEGKRVVIPQYHLPDERAVEEECQRFEAAIVKVEKDLEFIKQGIRPAFREHAGVIEAHQLILRDPHFHDESLRLIREERINAHMAVMRSLLRTREIFGTLDDEYIRSRIADVESVGDRVLRSLSGQEQNPLDEIENRVILVAHDLSPADTAQLQLERILGLVMDMGGRTSHTSIIARSLNIPAVVGTEFSTKFIATGDLIIVDGATGQILVNPSNEEIEFYSQRQEQFEAYLKEISRVAHLPAKTLDGHHVSIEANIELIEEIVAVKDNGAEGIGLYRTEFFFMNRAEAPDEETLYAEYRELAELTAPQWINIRTLDMGAEKLAAWYPKHQENNPALGLRSIRLCLQYRDLFKEQLRAILRASASTKNIRLMFPLISGVGELLETKKVLREVQEELTLKRIPFDTDMPLGVMIEVPSAVAVADMLAKEVDFFSIGTNDLIQYSIAIDRVNEFVAYLYEPLHPGVLRLIRQTVLAGRRAGIQVSICGEMAGESLFTPVLLGLQLDALSMNPQAIPRVKNLVNRSCMTDCINLVKRVLKMRTAKDINAVLLRVMEKHFPEELRLFEAGGKAASSGISNPFSS